MREQLRGCTRSQAIWKGSLVSPCSPRSRACSHKRCIHARAQRMHHLRRSVASKSNATDESQCSQSGAQERILAVSVRGRIYGTQVVQIDLGLEPNTPLSASLLEATPWPLAYVCACIEWQIRRDLAGGMAEIVSAGERRKTELEYAWLYVHVLGMEADYQSAERCLEDLRQLKRRHYGLRRFEMETANLVLRAWPAIEALARALVDAGTLEFEAAYDIIARHLP